MSAFNTVVVRADCPQHHGETTWRIQFKYGDVWDYTYHVGDILGWGGNEIGEPGKRLVVVDGVAEPCPVCGYDPGDYEVWLEVDRIVRVERAPARSRFVETNEPYLVIDP